MKKLIKNEIDEVFVPIKNKENAKPQVVIYGNIHSKDVSDSIKSTSFQEASQWLDKELKKKKI